MIFEKIESSVRSYCRDFPIIFDQAKDEIIFSEDGKSFIDFFAGAGALNYGHNNNYIKDQIINYILSDRIMHGLDMYTKAKEEFLESFFNFILKQKKLDYKIQFCGPTGTNAVEAALKLARKYTGRTGVFSFMGGFHGMSLGSLAVTSNKGSRKGAGRSLDEVTFIPFPDNNMGNFDSLQYLEYILEDTHSGIETPAAIIFESIQAEGGVNIAEDKWLKGIVKICDKHQILLICDDIQVGCGRTGPFFSFENAGITPDIIVLSKSISGYGLPMSMLLMRPDLDVWYPGEHNGTFRGNQLAFVAAKAAIEYRFNVSLEKQVKEKEAIVSNILFNEVLPIDTKIVVRGKGLIWGIDLSQFDETIPKKIQKSCFANGLIVERVGRRDAVIKIMPPLNIANHYLIKGCEIIKDSIRSVLNHVIYNKSE